MKTPEYNQSEATAVLLPQKVKKPAIKQNVTVVDVFAELERRVKTALETYSNVHRGTGQFSMVSTVLFEHARDIVLEHLALDKNDYCVVFCSPYSAELFSKQIHEKNYSILSSNDIGLPLGIRAMAVKKRALPRGIPFQTGGSVAKMVSRKFIIWADAPQKFEAGTPGIINAIAFAVGLILTRHYGSHCFKAAKDPVARGNSIFNEDVISGYSGNELLNELANQLVGKYMLVPTREGERPYINFDNAASTPTFFPVWNAVISAWRQSESKYPEIISEVKMMLADFLGADLEEYETIFTYNTTEAINLATRLIINEKTNSEIVILNTLLEHNSNELPWRFVPGASLVRLQVSREGFVDMTELEQVLRQYNQEKKFGAKRIRMVAVSGASNVLGSFNDLRTIAGLAHKYGARILVDGAQLVAHRRVFMKEWGIDYLAFSGHKVYAPFGSGALVVRKGLLPSDEGETTKMMISGEENIAGIAAIGKAISLLKRVGMDAVEEKEKALLRRLMNGLLQIRGLKVYGVTDPGSSLFQHRGGIVSFSLRNVAHITVAGELANEGGIGIRFGCFCTHLLVKYLVKLPPALEVVQQAILTLFPGIATQVPGLVRVSIGIQNEISEVDRFLEVMQKITLKSVPTSLSSPALSLKSGIKEQKEKFCAARIQKVFN